ncbi:MAG: TIM barrel protein [Candidatus Thorarchaeota archaeon]
MKLNFGIKPLEFDLLRLLTNPEKRESLESLVTLFERALEFGFRHFEIAWDYYYALPKLVTEARIAELVEFKEDNNVTFTLHAPIWGGIELASHVEKVRRASVDILIDSLEASKELKPERMVIHLSGEFANNLSSLNPLKENPVFELIIPSMEKSLTEIISKSGKSPEFFSIENIEFPLDIFLNIVRDKKAKLCLDTGHFLAGTKQASAEDLNLMNFLRSYLEEIDVIHAHDGGIFWHKSGNFLPDDHRALGNGIIPWKDMVSHLIDQKFSKPIIFQLTLPDAKQSLELISKEFPDAVGEEFGNIT